MKPTSWNGAPIILNDTEAADMEQTPNGTMFFLFTNLASRNSIGKLEMSSHGSQPEFLTAPAGMNAPEWIHQNWGGQKLTVTNVSGVDVPIQIQAKGPGMVGCSPEMIQVGTVLPLEPGKCAEGELNPAPMQLVFSNPKYVATFALIGGPPVEGESAYTFTVNAQTNTAPTAGTVNPVPGDYSTTSDTFEFPVNWGASKIWVANISAEAASGSSVELVLLK